MNKSVRFQTSIIILSSLMFFSACSQHGYQNDSPLRVLTPTVETAPPVSGSDQTPLPPKKIKVGEDTVLLGQMKLSKALGSFDKKSLLISVEAEVTIDNLTEKFKLEGKVHQSGFANLYPIADATQKNTEPQIQIRARATCLKVIKNRQFSCESAVIDIYALYKKQIYSEQMKLTEDAQVSVDNGTHPGNQGPPPIDDSLPGFPLEPSQHPPVKSPSEPTQPITEEDVEEENIPDSPDQSDIEDKNDENEVVEESTTEETAPDKTDSPGQAQPQPQPAPSTPTAPHHHEDDGKGGRYVGTVLEGILKLFEQTKDDGKAHPIPSLDPKKANRPTDQAIDLVSSGKLQNASSFLSENQTSPFIGILAPEIRRFYATWDLIEMMKHLSKVTQESLPHYTLYMKDASKTKGGFLGTNRKSGHKSHQNGLDIDVAYLVRTPERQSRFTNIIENGGLAKDVYIEETWKVFKAALTHPMGEIIFTNAPLKKALCSVAKKEKDPKSIEVLKRIRVEKGHQNHFHLRLKCGDYNPRCRDIDYRDYEVGC